MNHFKVNNRGAISIIGASIASVIFASSTLFYLSMKEKAVRVGMENQERAIADTYAAELLEVFVSLSSTQMLTFLSEHPMGTSSGFNPYPLCAHINLVDRSLGKVMNIDSQAEMPDTILKNGNRYYQVQVVKMDTLQVNYKRCMDTAKDMLTDPAKALKPDERLLVTVGIQWDGKAGRDRRNSVLTTVLARE